MFNKLRKMAVVAVTAGALMLAGGIAQAENAKLENSVGPANIDPAKTGSISVHKKLNPETTKKATGLEDPDAKGKPLQGVNFTISKVDADLTTINGFKDAAKLTVEAAKNKLDGNFQKQTLTTDEQGLAPFTALKVGVYLIEETLPENPDLKANGQSVKADELVPSKPFLVYVPMTSPDKKSWIYDVHVYPKNSTDTLVKSVVDAGKNAGDQIKYTIDVSAPLLVGGNYRTKFVVKDKYDNTKLEDVKVVSVKVGENKVTEGTDYDVEEAANSGVISVVFKNENGENSKLVTEIANNAVVSVEISAKMKADANGEIVNEGTRIDRDSSMEADREKPTNKVYTYLGKVQIQKTDVEGKPLSGAKFELYRCTAEGDKPKTYNLTSKAIETLVTDAEGSATSKGIHVTDFEDNKDGVAPENMTYCLKEVEAPAGYVLPQGNKAITPFTLTRADLNIGGKGDPVLVKLLKAITNEKSETPDLPLTGGKGIALLVVLGAAVGAGAIWSARRNSVKN